jgi:hypothetical protein
VKILDPSRARLAPSSQHQRGPAGAPYLDPGSQGQQGAPGSEPAPGIAGADAAAGQELQIGYPPVKGAYGPRPEAVSVTPSPTDGWTAPAGLPQDTPPRSLGTPSAGPDPWRQL